MATRMYLRNLTPDQAPTAGEHHDNMPVGTLAYDTSLSTERSLSLSKGTSETSQAQTSLAQTGEQSGMLARFSSGPLAAQAIAANTWTVAVALAESNASANAFLRVGLYLWRPSNSSQQLLYFVLADLGVEWSTAEDGQVVTFTNSGTPTAADGDLLVLEVWSHATQAMATAYTHTLWFDGTTDVVDATTTDAASYLETPQDLVFPGIFPPWSQQARRNPLVRM